MKKRFKISVLIVSLIILLGIAAVYFTYGITGFAINVSTSPVDVCQDSDGGMKAEATGYVEGVGDVFGGLWKEYYQEHDRCINERMLVEWSCQQGDNGYNKVSTKIACSGRCLNGACIFD